MTVFIHYTAASRKAENGARWLKILTRICVQTVVGVSVSPLEYSIICFSSLLIWRQLDWSQSLPSEPRSFLIINVYQHFLQAISSGCLYSSKTGSARMPTIQSKLLICVNAIKFVGLLPSHALEAARYNIYSTLHNIHVGNIRDVDCMRMLTRVNLKKIDKRQT